MPKDRLCKECSKPFRSQDKRVKFCSPECYKFHRSRRRPPSYWARFKKPKPKEPRADTIFAPVSSPEEPPMIIIGRKKRQGQLTEKELAEIEALKRSIIGSLSLAGPIKYSKKTGYIVQPRE